MIILAIGVLRHLSMQVCRELNMFLQFMVMCKVFNWKPQGNNKEQFFHVCMQSCFRLSHNYIAPFTQVLASNVGLVLRW